MLAHLSNDKETAVENILVQQNRSTFNFEDDCQPLFNAN